MFIFVREYFSRKVEGKKHLGDLGVDGRVILKWILLMGCEVVD
jgi:hypothetical protein